MKTGLNEIINNDLKFKVENNVILSLNVRKNKENINLKVSKTKNGKIIYYQNVMIYVIIKNQDLLRSKKQKDYYLVQVLKHH